MVNLVTVVGENIHILPHMLKHYEDKVDKIYVGVYRQNENDTILDQILDLGIHPFMTITDNKYNWERVTEMYNAFNEIIESTSDCVDKRILIFRDILQMISIVRSTHIEKILAEQRIEKLIKDNEDLGAQVAALVTALSTCTGEGDNVVCAFG